MITYCKKCGINWASLRVDHVDDETYESCPVCTSDRYLEPGNDIIAYICCPFTGKITNVDTGELLVNKPAILTDLNPKKTLVWDESHEDWKKRAEEVEDATPLNVPVPMVDRKCHFE